MKHLEAQEQAKQAAIDDSKEGIINIERGEEDVSKRHATSDEGICAVPAGAVQATDGFDNRLTEDGCLPELVCVTAGDDDSDPVEQMESVASNDTAGDDEFDSGTSGWGTEANPGPERLASRARRLQAVKIPPRWTVAKAEDKKDDVRVIGGENVANGVATDSAGSMEIQVAEGPEAAQDSKRARIAGPDADTLAEAGA